MSSVRSDDTCRRIRQLTALFVIFLALSASAAVVMQHQDVSDAAAVADVPANDVYTISFDPAGGSPAPPAQTTDRNGKLTEMPTVKRDGYSFDGWFTKDGKKVSTDYTFHDNETIVAHWTEKPSSGADNLLYIIAGLMVAIMVVGVGIAFLVMKRAKSKGNS